MDYGLLFPKVPGQHHTLGRGRSKSPSRLHPLSGCLRRQLYLAFGKALCSEAIALATEGPNLRMQELFT